MTGAAAFTPESLGTGTPLGFMLGAGAGRGVQNFLNQMLGLDNPSTLQGYQGMANDASIAGLTAGAGNAISKLPSAIKSAYSNTNLIRPLLTRALLGRTGSRLLEMLPDLLETEGKSVAKPVMDRSPMFADEAESAVKATTPTQVAKPTQANLPLPDVSKSKFSLYGDKADIDKFIAQILAGK
jgi:hypothetical protein